MGELYRAAALMVEWKMYWLVNKWFQPSFLWSASSPTKPSWIPSLSFLLKRSCAPFQIRVIDPTAAATKVQTTIHFFLFMTRTIVKRKTRYETFLSREESKTLICVAHTLVWMIQVMIFNYSRSNIYNKGRHVAGFGRNPYEPLERDA